MQNIIVELQYTLVGSNCAFIMTVGDCEPRDSDWLPLEIQSWLTRAHKYVLCVVPYDCKTSSN